MTIKEVLIKATKELKRAKIDSSTLDADVLLSYLLKKPKEYLYAHPEKILTDKQQKKYNQLIKKRANRMPAAYLTDQKEFYGLNFYVDQNVLIPRPFTERLVEGVLQEAKKNKNKKITIADIGTGSGCIAIAVKKYLPQATLYATDLSPKALTVAQKNARQHKLPIQFFQGDLLEPIKDKKIDYLLANLPYLKSNQIKKELKYEPRQSMVGSLNDIKRLLRQINKLKKQPVRIFLEIDKRQEKAVAEVIKKYRLKATLVSAFAAFEHGTPKK